MKKRRYAAALLALALAFVWAVPALAADSSQSYAFTLAANGQEALTVAPGDTFTVSVMLSRTDDAGDFTMYAAGYVLVFSAKLFSLDTDSITFEQTDGRGVRFQYSEEGDDARLTVSVKSADFEGAVWSNPTELLSFRLTAQSLGSSMFRSERAMMSTIYGGPYASEANSVLVSVSNEEPGLGQTGGSENSASGKKTSFSDVPAGSWFEDAVGYVTEAGLFNGVGDGRFDPDSSMTRAMFVTVLHRYAGKPMPTADPAFTDVPVGQWYSDAIAWATANGIVNGYGDGVFGLNDKITLEQMVTVLYRYSGASASGGLPVSYGYISGWAEDAMRWAEEIGLFHEVGGKLTAGQPATRAQVAAFMANFNRLYQGS